jgi:glucan phosphorylase
MRITVGKPIVNVGRAGKFSSDRTIAEYTTAGWNVRRCPAE